MGYELRIVRKNDFNDDAEDSNITLEEWVKYVESDKELILLNGCEMYTAGGLKWQESPGFSEWIIHSVEKDVVNHPWFDFFGGTISTKNPDDPTIKKMIEIAEKLNAKVQGEEDEFYDEKYFEKIAKNQKKKWWKFW